MPAVPQASSLYSLASLLAKQAGTGHEVRVYPKTQGVTLLSKEKAVVVLLEATSSPLLPEGVFLPTASYYRREGLVTTFTGPVLSSREQAEEFVRAVVEILARL